MEVRSSKRRGVLMLLLALNLIFSVAVLSIEIVERLDESRIQDQYVLYIGTNDKDTNQPEIPFDECQMRVEKVCLQYVSGFTITDAAGVWTDDTGNVVKEKTLVCSINGASEADVRAIVDQLLTELNQSSIMVEHQKLMCTYRSH